MQNNFYAQFEDANESVLPDLFSDDEINETPALEALEDDLNALGAVDGRDEAEANNKSNKSEEEDTTDDAGGDNAPTDNDGEESDDSGEETEDLAAATDEQLEADGETADPNMDGEGGEDIDTTDTSVGDADTTASDPLRSIETKDAYRKKFVKLYSVIIDSITTMNTFTPEYTIEISKEYYKLREQLTELKDLIYIICTKKMSSMTVDEVLRKYSLCNLSYDAITRGMDNFMKEYNKQRKKMETLKGVKEAAKRMASSRNYQSISHSDSTTK